MLEIGSTPIWPISIAAKPMQRHHVAKMSVRRSFEIKWPLERSVTLNSLPGPAWSKLKTSLVNVSLNFQNLISLACEYFLFENCEKLLSLFQQKKFSVFGY